MLVVGGCGFSATSSPNSDASTDAMVDDGRADATSDASGPSCLDRWRDHTIRFAAATPLATNDPVALDRDPFVVPNERTLYFSSSRALVGGGTAVGGADIFISTRATITESWGAASRDAAFSSGGYDGKVSIDMAATHAFVSNTSAGSGQIYELTRPNAAVAWGPPSTVTTAGFTAITGPQYDPSISANALRLYWAPAPTGLTQRIYTAQRPGVAAPFGTPSEVTELTSNTGEGDPSLGDDEQLILFYSNRELATKKAEIYYATRTTAAGVFSAPLPVPDINTTDDEGDPHISSNGCRIYFGRRLANGNWDLFSATAIP